MVARHLALLLLLVAVAASIATAHAAQPAVLLGDACSDFSVATAAPNGGTAQLSYPGHGSDTPSDAAVPALVLLAMQHGVAFHQALWNADSISVSLAWISSMAVS